MATLSITVDDLIVPRLRAAYGVSTNTALKSAIIKDIRRRVIEYEAAQTRATQETNVRQAQEEAITAENTTRTDADTQIVLT